MLKISQMLNKQINECRNIEVIMRKIGFLLIILTSCFTLTSCCNSQNKQVAEADNNQQMDKCNCGPHCACASSQNEHACGLSCKNTNKK